MKPFQKHFILQVNLRRLILFIALSGMSVIFINSYFAVYDTQKKLLTDQFFKINLNYSLKLANTVETFFSSSQSQLSFSAQLLADNMKNAETLQKEVDRIRQIGHRFNSVSVIDKQGYIRAFSPLQPGVIDAHLTSPSHAAAVQANTFFISQPYVSLIGNLIVYISVPIHSAEGEQLGYVGGSIYLNNRNATNEFMNSQFDDNNYDTFVLNKDGTIIYHHDKSRIGQKIDDTSLKHMALLGNKGNFRLTDSQGATFLAGFAKVKRADWIILTLQTEQIVTQALNNVMIDVTKKSAPVLLITLFMITLLTIYIAKPLRMLGLAASRMDDPDVISKIRAVSSWYFEVEHLKRVILWGTILLHKRIGKLSSQAHTDPLTGLLNRRGLHENIEMSLLNNSVVSVIVIDIDHFKNVNDTYGHDVGDEVIKMLGRHLKTNSRKTDLVCRTGGEEFLMLLPGIDIHLAVVIAERLRKNVAEMSFPICQHITISIGVTSFLPKEVPIDAALKTADNALYRAKKAGRNKVIVQDIPEDLGLMLHKQKD
ncbi:sensor domain-containing diguanylate cyclase [Candidatus Symbiopectobacterium sp. NZEC135]|uniref:sensor domain-containing diguanylate cyclase n=1 Tax=Candidatus Symbiopectobacterium sp. NZEC135 TaxID=2820471 RepID=UPI0022269D56|nr:sensor domain-containing diguanylate cyclase [Candidatus Symbiopectobacterium sp. NZEC135]MCW2478818.1 GGDEF domain-containing protein [Candidatus Symbiopectobacterium sp. NZEC135]